MINFVGQGLCSCRYLPFKQTKTAEAEPPPYILYVFSYHYIFYAVALFYISEGLLMDVIGIITLFIPVVTFAMGYFLTDIGYKRDRKLSIVREKFEKLYHPFYMLVCELGTDTEGGDGFALNTEDSSAFGQLFDHLIHNAYLATSEGQSLIWETRMLFVSCNADGNNIDKEKEQLLEKSIRALFGHLIQEYVKSASALGYDLSSSTEFGAKDVV